MTFVKWFGRLLRWILVLIGLGALAVGFLLAVPLAQPPELASIRAGSLAIDQTGLPEPTRFQARDGTLLAYHLYPAAAGGKRPIVVLIQGSAGMASMMNEIAKRLAAEDFTVVAPDIRGHGASGTRGDIAYIGQTEDDLVDLVAELRRRFPGAHFSLGGFSLGGGFALRAASGSLEKTFDRVVLLSPFLGHDAPSSRPDQDAAHWAEVDVPRLLTLVLLQRLHLACCDALPVIAFAVAPGTENFVTPRYSYRLFASFAAPHDAGSALRRLAVPTSILVGAKDELMIAENYAGMVSGITPKIDVTILPGLGHMDMLHAPAALDAVVAAFKQ